MKISQKRVSNKIIIYQIFLAVAAASYFFTGFDVYSTVYKPWIAMPPGTFFIILFSIAAFTLIAIGHLKFVPPWLIAWCIFYLMISLIGASPISFTGKDGITAEFPLRVLSVMVLLSTVTIFTRHQQVVAWVRFTVFLAIIMAMYNNIYELLNPELFSTQTIDPSLLDIANLSGRPAGIYLDPNRAGGALILGMIFTIGIIPRSWQFLYAIIIGFGVFVTFSRGAILAWVIILPILLIRRTIKIQLNKAFIAVISVFFTLALILSLSQTSSNLFNFELHANNQERLETFLSGSTGEDSGRGNLYELAVRKFLDSPIAGNGTGADIGSVGESAGKGAHNGYLKYMVENGILGGFFLPLLVFAVAWNSKGQAKDIAISFTIFMLIWGFFSHNILEERHILVSVSLMAAIKKTESQSVDTEPIQKSKSTSQ